MSLTPEQLKLYALNLKSVRESEKARSAEIIRFAHHAKDEQFRKFVGNSKG